MPSVRSKSFIIQTWMMLILVMILMMILIIINVMIRMMRMLTKPYDHDADTDDYHDHEKDSYTAAGVVLLLVLGSWFLCLGFWSSVLAS